MKKLILFFVMMFTLISFAQEKTLMTGGITSGGYGGPEIKFTQIGDKFGVLLGGKGGWIINHTFIIGGGGYGLVNDIIADAQINDRSTYLNFGYGGVILEYVQNSDELLHYTFSALIGGGGVNLRAGDYHDAMYGNTENFFVLEPGANAEVNVTSFFRINAGISYRFLSNVTLDNFNQDNLGGVSGNLTFKFGSF